MMKKIKKIDKENYKILPDNLTVGKSKLKKKFSPVLPGSSDIIPVKYKTDSRGEPEEIELTTPDKPAPYTFVPVVLQQDPENALIDVVWHDGSSGQDTLSGELCCTLTALSPLFVGHYQYKLEDRQDIQLVNYREEVSASLDSEVWGDFYGNTGFSIEKNLLEPAFVGSSDQDLSGKPVLIAGSSLKGMIRHNIGALFSSPMEKVQEQFFSYRPNLGFNTTPSRYESRIAIVREVDLKALKLKLDVAACGTRAKFTNPSATDCKYIYKGGIDGTGVLAKKGVHDGAWLPHGTVFTNINIPVDEAIISHYLLTQQELADQQRGHLSRRKDLKDDKKEQAAKLILQNINLEPNQLIYVEIDPEIPQVVSFGHHYRYRWRYSDSVQMVKKGITGARELRPEIGLLEGENVDGSDASKLSAARLLFGYVSGEEDNDGNKSSGKSINTLDMRSNKLAEKDTDYVNMAGRISINTAIEQGDLSNLDKRFVKRSKNSNIDSLHRFTIPLKILGQPRASAVEHYLQQDDKYLKTYGDLPGVEPSGTALNGRKFYRHQPVNGNKTFEETDAEKIRSNQSAFAQFISQPGTQFRFKVRFRDLRSWELGALMLALDPRLGRKGTANKLGHGRPLGLGSVSIDIDRISFLELDGTLKKAQEEKDSADYINDLMNHTAVSAVQVGRWLDVLQFEGAEPAAYPNAEHNIYTYHSNIRALYSVLRRDGAQMPENFGQPVKPKPASR